MASEAPATPAASAAPAASVEEMLRSAEARFQAAKERLMNLIKSTAPASTAALPEEGVPGEPIALPDALAPAKLLALRPKKSATEYVLKPENWGELAAAMGVNEKALGVALPLLGGGRAGRSPRSASRNSPRLQKGAGAAVSADVKGSNGGKPFPPSRGGPNARAAVGLGKLPAKSDRGAFGGGGVRDLLIAAADGYAGGGSSAAARRGGQGKTNGAKDGDPDREADGGEFNLHLGGDIDALRRALGEQQRIAIAATHARMNLLGVGAAVASGRQVSQRAEKKSAESAATLEALSILNGAGGANSRPVSRAPLAGVMRPSSRAALLSTRDAPGPSSSRPSLSGRPLSSARSTNSVQYPVSTTALRSAGLCAALREDPQVSDISTIVVPKSYSLTVSAAASAPLTPPSDETFFPYSDKTSAVTAVNAIHADVFRVATREIHDATAVSDAEALAAEVAASMGFGEDCLQAGPSESESLESAPSTASSEDASSQIIHEEVQGGGAVVAASEEVASRLDGAVRLTSPPESREDIPPSSNSSLGAESCIGLPSATQVDQGTVLSSKEPLRPLETVSETAGGEAEVLPTVEIPSTPAELWPTDIPKDQTPLYSSAPGSPERVNGQPCARGGE
jgi:hypothetical protein